MFKSFGQRFLVVGLLVLLMFIPLFFAAEIVENRRAYSRTTIEAVGAEWGGAQMLRGPFLVVPTEQDVEKRDVTEVISETTGEVTQQSFLRLVTEAGRPVYVLPEHFELTISSETQVRSRGIFEVPVYVADLEMQFRFDAERAEKALAENERLLWDRASVQMFVTNNASLRGETVLMAGAQSLNFEPLSSKGGIEADLPDPALLAEGFTLSTVLNGARSLKVAPVGRLSAVSIESDWPHPSFVGGFLPDDHAVSETGFEARWSIPHLARNLPQVSREFPATHQLAFGVDLIQTNDFYQKAYRAARYGVLFIAMTFLTVLLLERGAGRVAHPVQYILIGLVQGLFALLMVAYAEHVGFSAAYLGAAGATVALLTGYAWFGLKLGRRSIVLGVTLLVVYLVLYLILKSTDFALLAGTTLVFCALAGTMVLTRDEEWFALVRETGEDTQSAGGEKSAWPSGGASTKAVVSGEADPSREAKGSSESGSDAPAP